MLLSLSATADYDLPQETFLLLMVEPRLKGEQHDVVQQSLRTSPTPLAELALGGFGNPLQRLVAPPGPFSFDFTAAVETPRNEAIPGNATEHDPRHLSPEVLLYMLTSRCYQSAQLARLAMGKFGGVAPGGMRVNAIAEWVRTHVSISTGRQI